MSGPSESKDSSCYQETSGGDPLINNKQSDHNTQEEISDVTRWANEYLGGGGYSDHHITDLLQDIADGKTLILLIQAISKQSLPKHYTNPMIKVHKLENVHICLDFLQQQRVQMAPVFAEDIVCANEKAILSLCHDIRRHYTAAASQGSKGHQKHKFNFSSLDKDDIALLSWLGKRVGRNLADYSHLYDGRVLCELMNELEEDAIEQEEIYSSSAEQRLELALKTAQKNFFISFGSLNAVEIASGSQDSELKSFLHQCKSVYHQSAVKGKGVRKSKRAQVVSQTPTSSSMESREAKRIASRTYEGIQQRKLANGELPSTHHSSQEKLVSKARKRPLSDIYVSGANSYTDLSTTRSEHAQMVRKHSQQQIRHPVSPTKRSSSSDNLEGRPVCNRHHSMDPLSSRGSSRQSHARTNAWKRQWVGYESDTSTGSTLLRSHSQGSITVDLPSSASGLSLGSRGGRGVGSVLAGRSLTRSIDSVNTPTFDTPNRSGSTTFRRVSSYPRQDSGSSAATADELSSSIAELEDRMHQLELHFLFGRHDILKQVHDAMTVEKRKRRALELRAKDLKRFTDIVFQRYDARFIELASEVSELRGEVLCMGKGKSSIAPSVTMEITQLKDQVNKLMEEKNSSKNVGGTAALLQFPKRSTKQSLFMRKRPDSDFGDQSNPSVSSSALRHGRQKGHSGQRPLSPTGDVLPPTAINQKPTGPFLLGSASSFKKLRNFFGAEPPRVQNLKCFLEDLGYPELLPVLDANGVSLSELTCMSGEHLEQLGIPFGQRVRILKEIQCLQPLEAPDPAKTADVI